MPKHSRVALRVVRLSGALAWISWLGVHLFYLIGVQNRLLVLTRWAFSFLHPAAAAPG